MVFRLGDDWIGTDMLPMRDTIRIDDNTETFEVEVDFLSKNFADWKIILIFAIPIRHRYICLF